jgi:hypothetical protein
MDNDYAAIMKEAVIVNMETARDNMKHGREGGAECAKAAASGATRLFDMGEANQKRRQELDLAQTKASSKSAREDEVIAAMAKTGTKMKKGTREYLNHIMKEKLQANPGGPDGKKDKGGNIIPMHFDYGDEDTYDIPCKGFERFGCWLANHGHAPDFWDLDDMIEHVDQDHRVATILCYACRRVREHVRSGAKYELLHMDVTNTQMMVYTEEEYIQHMAERSNKGPRNEGEQKASEAEVGAAPSDKKGTQAAGGKSKKQRQRENKAKKAKADA